MPPGRRFAVLTCMDARLDPAKYAGLAEGDAHVIRNAGGRASDDAIRSLVISYKLLGSREWFVIHHTDCGMETFTDEVMRKLLRSSLKCASMDATGWHDAECAHAAQGFQPGHGGGDARFLRFFFDPRVEPAARSRVANLSVRRTVEWREDFDEETHVLRRGIWKTGTA